MNKNKYKEIMNNLNRFKTIKKKCELTKEQKEFLLKCREGNNVVSWDTMAKLWEEIGWGKITSSGLRYLHKKIR